MTNPEKVVLLIDDTATTRESMARFLEARLAWRIHAVQSKEEALERLGSGNLIPDLVLIDQVFGDNPEGGTQAIPEILHASPHSFIVVYSAEAKIDEVTFWRALAAGAHRYISKSSPTDLLRDLQELVDEVEEVAEVTALVRELTETRGAMVSTLLGVGVKVSLIDRYHRVWFSNRPEAAANAPPQGAPCWTYFHGTPVEWGPCPGCALLTVLETKEPYSCPVLTRTRDGRPEWARGEGLPIPSKRRSDKRVIAVREAYMPLPAASVGLDPEDRLQTIANGLLIEGYGRVRIYRYEDNHLAGAACATRLPHADHDAYLDGVRGFRVAPNSNAYVLHAFEERDGTLWNAWHPALGGADRDIAMQLDLSPPWADVPVWNGQDLIGWLAVDLKGAPKQALEANDLDILRRYRDEIAGVLGPDPARAGKHSQFRHLVTEARFNVAQARDPQEILNHIVQIVCQIMEPVAGCEDVRVRTRRGGYLAIQASLQQSSDTQPDGEKRDSISATDPKSFAAFVATVGSPLYIDNCADYAARAQANPALRPGLRDQRIGSLAILPLKVDNLCFGTLSIECRRTLRWDHSPAIPYLLEVAALAALAVRDLHVQQQIAEGKQAFGIIHGIKGPASAARNALAVLRSQDLTPLALQATELIDTAVTRIEKVATRLMRMTHSDAKRIDINSCIIDDLIEECCQAARIAEPNLRVCGPTPLPKAVIRINVSEIRAVFEELATNSARAGATVVMVLAKLDDGHMIINFDDNGQGFEPAEVEYVFERWYSNFGGGNGLGLPWVRSVVSDFRGQVRAQPLERGARIEIILPLKQME